MEDWKLSSMCESGSGKPPQSVKVLTYNLFWWNLFGQRDGNDGSAGKLIAKSHKDAPFDFIGFQECDDVDRVMQDAGLTDSFETIDGEMSIALAYNRHKWQLLSWDRRNVAEDREDQYYGRRNGVWARLQSLSTRRVVLFVNHHGPLPVNTGGKCTGRSVAYQLFRMIGYHAHWGDAVVLVGDFNADRNSDTARVLDDQLKPLYTGVSFNGVDHIYGQCVKSNPQTENLGNGGSDHDALAATIELS
jgi:endonuclease/exonuclease/phosphatase family metal-dependent hydrolase